MIGIKALRFLIFPPLSDFGELESHHISRNAMPSSSFPKPIGLVPVADRALAPTFRMSPQVGVFDNFVWHSFFVLKTTCFAHYCPFCLLIKDPELRSDYILKLQTLIECSQLNIHTGVNEQSSRKVPILPLSSH